MIITINRSGGFTGIPLTKTIDTSTLPPKEADELESRIMNQELWKATKNKPSSPDRFTYTISVADGELNQAIQLNEQSMDMQAKEFIEKIFNF